MQWIEPWRLCDGHDMHQMQYITYHVKTKRMNLIFDCPCDVIWKGNERSCELGKGDFSELQHMTVTNLHNDGYEDTSRPNPLRAVNSPIHPRPLPPALVPSLQITFNTTPNTAYHTWYMAFFTERHTTHSGLHTSLHTNTQTDTQTHHHHTHTNNGHTTPNSRTSNDNSFDLKGNIFSFLNDKTNLFKHKIRFFERNRIDNHEKLKSWSAQIH